MERITWSILLFFIGLVYCKPYYYRESKQHAEHHREYSYDGSPVHISPTAGQEATTLQFSTKPIPEKYYSAVYPIQSQSFQSQGGSYQGFSHGALSAVPLLYSQQPYGGNVVVRKVVKVFTYPPTSSQTGFVQVSQSRTGSDVLGSEKLGSDSLLGQRLVTESAGEGVYSKYFPSDKIHSGQRVTLVKTEHSQYGRSGQTFGSEVGQKEESEELSQQPYDENLELGQKEISLYQGRQIQPLKLGQQEESTFLGQQSENLEIGQKEETEYPNIPNGFSQSGQRLYHSAQSSHFELGQKEESSNLELGQREESLIPPESGQIELGQSEDSSFLEVGQKEENLYQNPQSENLELGQKEESSGPEIGQKEESLYQNPHSGSLDLGQREESLNLELGQREESANLEVGQKEESLYQNHQIGHLELGQREESSNLEVGQREESLYQNPHSGSLDLGQREESSNLELGQREESIYQQPQGGNLVVGQREESSGFEIGQREESLYQNPHSGSLDLGQREESADFEVGQREESLYQNPQKGLLELGQREESSSLEVGQKEESLYHNPPRGDLDLGQREESVYESSHSGQKEEKLRVSSHNEQLELGQREEPLLVPIKKQFSGTQYHREESVRHINVPSPHFISGQQPDVIRPLVQPEISSTIRQVTRIENPQVFGLVPHNQVYQNGYSSQKEIICEHSQHHSHGGYGTGQRGHNLQVLQTGDQLSSQFQNKEEGKVNLNVGEKRNKLDKTLDAEQTFNEKVTREPVQHEVNYYQRKVNQTTSVVHSSSLEPSHIVAESFQKPHHGREINLNKKIEDLALELELEGIMNKPSKQNEEVSTTVVVKKVEETTPRPLSTEVHTAEIQELGFENFNKKLASEVNILKGVPERLENVYETHREEYGLNYPPTRKTYSKKHSRQYTRTSEGYSGQPTLGIERYTEYNPLQSAGQTSGSSYSYQRSYSTNSGGSYPNDQPVLKQHVSRTEFLGGNQEGNKQAVIDEFLKELDRDIARSGGKKAQSGFVQVTSQQQPSSSGSSFYSEKSYSSHSSHSSSSSSSGSGGRSWFQKVGDSVGSTYNKAIDKIGTSYNQAKDKAKEIVDNVKHQISYY